MKKMILFFLFLSSIGFSESKRDSYYYPLPKADRIHKPLSENPPRISGYNTPAGIDVRNSWDIFSTASFILWSAREEGLELATSNDASSGINGVIIQDKPNFKPGFQLGLGFHTGPDDWELFGQYTWYHMSHSRKSYSPPNGILLPRWFTTSPSLSATMVKQNWKLGMDVIDIDFSRHFYSGTRLTFKTTLSVRGIKLRQRLKYQAALIGIAGATRTANNRSRSWGIGPRFGIDTQYLIGFGFRFYGNFSSSLLYSRFKTRVSQEDPTDTTITEFINVKDDVWYLRPNMEFQTGFGWGTYFCNYRFHIDFSTSYDFRIFWNQNLMRHLSDSLIDNTDTNFGDLFLQGLTMNVRFDF